MVKSFLSSRGGAKEPPNYLKHCDCVKFLKFLPIIVRRIHGKTTIKKGGRPKSTPPYPTKGKGTKQTRSFILSFFNLKATFKSHALSF